MASSKSSQHGRHLDVRPLDNRMPTKNNNKQKHTKKTKTIKTIKNKIIKGLVLGQSRADTRLTKVLALLEKGELLELLCGVTILFLWGGASRETFKDVETAPARFQFFEGLPSNDDVKNVSRMVYPTRECLASEGQVADLSIELRWHDHTSSCCSKH